jgi:DNA-binding winged helix-turn-helix (wHTH) protein
MNVFSFGPFRLDPSRRILRKHDTVVTLRSRAFDLLVAMVDQHGKVLTPDELMAIAWPGVVVDESNLRVSRASAR